FMVARFTPLGAYLFLGVPMDSIANAAVDLDRIDPAIARAVMDNVARVRGWPARFAAMDALIAARIADAARPRAVADAVSGAVAHVWQRLVATDGAVPLGLLAAELDCSHRALIARFRTSVGFPPKTIARLLRFNRVVHALDRASRTRADGTVGKPYIESAQTHERRIRDGAARRSNSSSIRWAEIAADCGYFDQAHLIKDFREFAGRTPTAFLHSVTDLG
ncbi:MAG TPA: helix-turn-helix domain-containing protein, partial [Pseudomonadales bacterium]|nr:helix-turn-helix domain-containing protein [Pseudomonadales bacterium]